MTLYISYFAFDLMISSKYKFVSLSYEKKLFNPQFHSRILKSKEIDSKLVLIDF